MRSFAALLLVLASCVCALTAPVPSTFFRHPPVDWLPSVDYSLSAPSAGDAVFIRPDEIDSLPHHAKSNHIQSLKERLRVKLPVESFASDNYQDIYSYSGFVNVNATYNSNMFFWFLQAQNGNLSAPIVVWLQGGPGGSSLFGLFGENGPFTVNSQLQLEPRAVHWNSEFHMMYIDNPVGVGFSFTGNSAGFSMDEDSVGVNLYRTITGFFQVFPEFAQNEFYITGESYAGKYIPAFAHKIHYENGRKPKIPINLQGMAIGDGLTDPLSQIQGYADILYNIGLADENEYQNMSDMQQMLVSQIGEERWADASQTFSNMVNGPPDYYSNITGSSNYYDIRFSTGRSYTGDYATFVNQSSIRAALHVGDNYYYQNGSTAGDLLNDDICKSMAPVLPDLLENYKVLFYNGQYDFIVAPPLTERMLHALEWNGAAQYRAAKKTIWYLKDDNVNVAGYVRQAGSYPVYQLVVRDAGHILPGDQPERGRDMITRFIHDLPWTN